MKRDYRKWSPEEDAHVTSNWDRKDLTVSMIGDPIGRDGAAVKSRSRLLGLGVKPAFDPWADDFAEVSKLYADGKGPAEIAVLIGRPSSQIRSKLNRAGLLKRRPEMSKAARAQKAKVAPPPAPSKPKGFVMPSYGGPGQPNPDERRATAAKANAEARENPAEITLGPVWEPLSGIPPVSLVDRRSSQCAWPLDLPQAGHWCCGALATAGVYCSTHGKLAKPKVGTKENLDRRLGIPRHRRAA